MTRRLLNLVTLLSLLLCVGVVVLWVQSEVRSALWGWPWDARWQFESADGEFRIIHQVPPPPGPNGAFVAYQTLPLPYWLLLCVMTVAAAPAIVAFAIRRRRVHAGGNVCRSCGYDLRATPDRCPECGHEVEGR